MKKAKRQKGKGERFKKIVKALFSPFSLFPDLSFLDDGLEK
jgi:hypothetical protein